MKRSLEILIVALLLGLGAGESFGQYLYWTTGKKVSRSYLDGTGELYIYTNRTATRDIEIYEPDDQMFFIDDDKIIRARLDGSGGTAIRSGIPELSAIALDAPNQRVFWAEDDGDDKIRSAKLDGTDVVTELVIEPLRGLTKTVDTLEFIGAGPRGGINRLYWTETNGSTPSKMFHFSPYGSGPPVEVLSLSTDQYISGLAIDPPAGSVYFTMFSYESPTTPFFSAIRRVDLEGNGLTNVLYSEHVAMEIDVHPQTGYLYWADFVSGAGFRLMRATKSGTSPTMLLETSVVYAIALETQASICPAQRALDELSRKLGTSPDSSLITRARLLRDAARREKPLGVFREFRDRLLRKSPEGRRLAELYYRHGGEMSRIVAEHPEVAFRTVEFFVRVLPAMRSALRHGGVVRVPTHVYRQGLALASAFESHASPELSTALQEARRFLAARTSSEARAVAIDFR